ncbi:MAG: hypothetical protein QOC89_4065 [Paraburkholderia sp.]|jgi:hypothetical protein|uniref:hypothetical protein n=1 Tax=Paraburkholderia sp. TaxID=1926495 RepID=UPI002AFF0447|nr:hypothetical protein [Paraburkholderia sp.]MEA3086368.1 hypothetical protein [Paraburkholderia sp.]
MGTTKYHIHVPIATLLAMPGGELTGTLSSGTGPELRAMLVCMQAAGKAAFTGGDCDRQDRKGICRGHPQE